MEHDGDGKTPGLAPADCKSAGTGGFDNTIYNNQWWHQLGGNHSTFYSEYYFWKLQQEHKQVR